MKYMLLLTRGEWQESGSDEDKEAVFVELTQWWQRHFAAGTMVAGQQLQPPETATTVVIERGQTLLLDRPLIEAKEAIGGYGILDVADLRCGDCHRPHLAHPRRQGGSAARCPTLTATRRIACWSTCSVRRRAG